MGYTKQGFTDGNVLYASELIKMEEGIIDAERRNTLFFRVASGWDYTWESIVISKSSPYYSPNGNYEIVVGTGGGGSAIGEVCMYFFYQGMLLSSTGFTDGAFDISLYRGTSGDNFYIGNISTVSSDTHNYGTITPLGEVEVRDLTCFIEGTQVTMADGTVRAIEDVCAGDELLYWSNGKKEVSTAKVLIPPFEGKCREYDVYSFADGTKLNIYGRQRMFNIEKNGMVNIADFAVGEHTLSINGRPVEYTGVQHVEAERELGHYWLVSSTGAYTVNGLTTGHVKVLTYMYLMRKKDQIAPGTNLEYYKSLYDCHMAKKNIFKSPEYLKETKDIRVAADSTRKRMDAIKEELSSLDYKTVKYYEGALTESEYKENCELKAMLRQRYAQLEKELAVYERELSGVKKKFKAIADAYTPADFRKDAT